MNLLFLGDCVGRPGMAAITSLLPSLRRELNLACVIVNAENAADGSGLTQRQFKKLVDSGVDCITMGDHIYRRDELIPTLKHDGRIVKPANYPDSAPGRNWTVIKTEKQVPVAVFSLMGRVHMRPVDCPFAAADRVLAEIPSDVKIRICDIHAEATSDKQLVGRYLDGKVSAVFGTHTHVPTADARVLPGGTAFQTDVGMTGPYESIIGRDVSRVMQTSLTFEPTHFYVATDDVRLCGAIVKLDRETGQAISITRFERAVA
jgi:2',3'-cyclic-nucleotide 2'-phosphodiesterase